MPLKLACASHSPLMRDGPCSDEVRSGVSRGFAALAATIRDFDPHYVIQFSPDHFSGFFYELMPAFCVGTKADAFGDWDTTAGPLDVPHDEAVALSRHQLRADFDVAQSHHMRLDHGFVQIWESLFGTATGLPIIPIFINCAAPPLPSFRRARQLGEAVGRFALQSGKRVLLATSGGLSHDPPIPSFWKSPPEVASRLLDPQNPTAGERAAREERTKVAGREAHAGGGAILPVSGKWDRGFLDRLSAGLTGEFDDLHPEDMIAAAGRGGPGVLCWMAAMAALATAGPTESRLHFYEAIQGWVAGMAIFSARTVSPASSPEQA